MKSIFDLSDLFNRELTPRRLSSRLHLKFGIAAESIRVGIDGDDDLGIEPTSSGAKIETYPILGA